MYFSHFYDLVFRLERSFHSRAGSGNAIMFANNCSAVISLMQEHVPQDVNLAKAAIIYMFLRNEETAGDREFALAECSDPVRNIVEAMERHDEPFSRLQLVDRSDSYGVVLDRMRTEYQYESLMICCVLDIVCMMRLKAQQAGRSSCLHHDQARSYYDGAAEVYSTRLDEESSGGLITTFARLKAELVG